LAKILINVHLKREILDPQGKAVLGAISKLNVNGIDEIRQGKQFVLTTTEPLSEFKLKEIKQLAENLLSNPVIEEFTIEVKE
jgi:phosphoribosylformylglycinamidine synthase subunit PurS